MRTDYNILIARNKQNTLTMVYVVVSTVVCIGIIYIISINNGLTVLHFLIGEQIRSLLL